MQTNWGNIQACGQASYTETTANLQLNAVTIVSFKFAVYQNDEIISTALHVKKKMLVAVHTSTINTVQREPEILNNSEIIRGFVC